MATTAGIDIVREGSVFSIDPMNPKSWSGPNSNKVNDLKSTITGSIYNDTSGSYGSNKSFAFDGVDDNINFGNISQCNFGSGDMSVSVWINTDTIASGNPDIIGIGTNGGTRIRVQRRANKAGAYLDSTSANSLTGGTTLTVDRWYNICLTKLGTTFTLYLDTISDGTQTITGNFTDTEVIVGAYFGGGSNYFDGSIGSIQIYNRTLSPKEIQQNYNALKGRFQ